MESLKWKNSPYICTAKPNRLYSVEVIVGEHFFMMPCSNDFRCCLSVCSVHPSLKSEGHMKFELN